jgi:molecular chaperone HtpG
VIETIRSNSVKKVLTLLNDLANSDKEKYATFWQEFGRVLKEGIAEDPGNRENLAKLLRFSTTASEGETQDVSFDDYIGRMKEGQDKVYFITAESYAAAKDSPLLEIFKKKGVEVLLLSDPVDYLFDTEFHEFKGKQFQSVSKEVDLSDLEDEQEKAEHKKSAGEVQDLVERLKKTLSEEVKDVRVTHRLTTSPACLVADEHDIDPTLQRMLKSIGQGLPQSKFIMEINPQHPIILKLKNETDDTRFIDWANVLYDQSMLGLGEQLANPTRFVNSLNSLLSQL